MKSGVTIAICASLLLIGGASWSRFTRDKTAAGLVAVQGKELTQDYYDQLAAQYIEVASSTPSDTEGPLTTTDLVSRQMIIDYLGLAENDQATEGNIQALANKYIETVPALITSPQKSLFDLKVVSNNLTNYQTYASRIQSIYSKYAADLLSSSPEPSSLSLSPQSAALAQKMAKIYENAAQQLLQLPVPSQLAEEHLALVNLYLQDAVAAGAIAVVNNDPASSFAGLVAFKENARKEQEILGNIKEILTNNGV